MFVLSLSSPFSSLLVFLSPSFHLLLICFSLFSASPILLPTLYSFCTLLLSYFYLLYHLSFLFIYLFFLSFSPSAILFCSCLFFFLAFFSCFLLCHHLFLVFFRSYFIAPSKSNNFSSAACVTSYVGSAVLPHLHVIILYDSYSSV